MMPAATHFDPVIGVDIHMIQPPGPVPPVPIPHPYVGMHLDPFDYAPFIGSTILVNGVHRAIAGTTGKAIPPHIPIGGVFVPVLPSNEHEAFMGAATVEFDGDAANFMALPCLSCQSIGMPPPPRLNPKKGTKITVPVLPLSVVLPVPKGPPVLIGGPPTISLMSLVSNMIGPLAQLFGMTKAGKKVFGAASKAADKAKDAASRVWRKAFSWMPPGFLKCKVLKAEPVDIRTGEVVMDQLDVEIPGRIPLRWKRYYRSSHTRIGVCGRGWDTPADARLELNADGSVLFLDGDGTGALFERGPQNGPIREPVDGWLLDRSSTHWRVRKKGGLTWHFPIPQGREVLVDSVMDSCGNWVQYQRGPHGLLRVLESAGRSFWVVSRGGLVQQIVLEHPDFEERRVLARFEYDAQQRLVAQYDALDHPYRFAWHADGRLARHTNRVGLSFHYEYDSAGRCVHSWGDGGLYDYHFRYDPNGRWTNWTDSLGHVWGVELDERGYVVAETDPLGGVTSYAYDEAGRTVRMTDPAGRAVTYEYDTEGNLVRHVQPDGTEIRRRFADGRAVQVEGPDGKVWRFDHDLSGHLARQRTPAGSYLQLRHDARGDLLRVERGDGAMLRNRLDAYGLIVAQSDWKGADSSYTRDILGHVVRRRDRLGGETLRELDACGRLRKRISATGAVEQWERDASGAVTAYTDPVGRRHSFVWINCHLREVHQPDGTVLRFAHDTESRLLAFTNEIGESFRYNYDQAGRMVRHADLAGRVTGYDYDASGMLVGERLQGGGWRRLARDGAGLVARIEASDGSSDEFTYDAYGQVIAMANADHAVQFVRDAEGRITEEIQDGIRITWTYGPSGAVSGRRIGTDHETALRRDANNLLLGLRAPGVDLAMERDANGRAVRLVQGGRPMLDLAYDPEGRVVAQRVHGDGETICRYGYDALGRLIAKRDERGVSAIRYHANGRPELVTLNGRLRESYAYDAAATLVASSLDGDAIPQPHRIGPGGAIVAVGHRGYAYDERGRLAARMTDEGVLRLRWDDLDRLREVVTPSGASWRYSYDPLGRRLLREGPDMRCRYVWDGDTLAQERPSAGAAVDWHFEPDCQRPLARASQGRSEVIVGDHIGRPAALLTATERPAHLWHSAFGVADGAVRACPLRSQGLWEDAESGLAYARYRYYDAPSGSFVSPDPTGLAGDSKLYAFPLSPLTTIDPFGLANPDYKTRNDHIVYGLFAEGEDTPFYVGRTVGDTASAEARHTKSGRLGEGVEMRELHSGLSYDQARGLEQANIQKHKTLTGFPGNEINGVRPSRTDDAAKRYRAAAAKLGCG